jgi:hypothetical protein
VVQGLTGRPLPIKKVSSLKNSSRASARGMRAGRRDSGGTSSRFRARLTTRRFRSRRGRGRRIVVCKAPPRSGSAIHRRGGSWPLSPSPISDRPSRTDSVRDH